MAFAAATPLGSPSIRIVSLLTSSAGMMMEVPVSVLMRFTTLRGPVQRWNERDEEAEEEGTKGQVREKKKKEYEILCHPGVYTGEEGGGGAEIPPPQKS